ncbi:hypothetical protein GCM10023146_23780 [Nocardioides caricicola]
MGKQGKKGKGPKVGGVSSGGFSMAQRDADEKWLKSGGLTRPHTKEGVAAARRLITINSVHRDSLRRYLATAPTGLSRKTSGAGKQVPLGPDGWPLSSSVRTVGGGLPGLGKRR